MADSYKFSSGDRRGNKRDVSFVLQNNLVIQRIKKNGRVTHDIKYTEEGFEEVVESVLDTQAQLDEQHGENGLPFNTQHLDASPTEKLQMVDDILASMDQREIQQLRDQDNSRYVDTEILMDIGHEPDPNKDNEKVREDVLQLIYLEYSFNWFTMPEFREVYNINYDKSRASRYLQQLDDKWLKKQEIPEEEREGNTKYRYKLNASAQRVIQKYGAFDTMEYPVYRKKCREYKS